MSNQKDNNFFLKSLAGVKPLKKNNKIIKPIPTPAKSNNPRTTIKEIESEKNYKNATNITTEQKTTIQKNDINKKLKKNKIPINRRIDLHGYSLEEAKKIFFNTVNDCFVKHYRCVLFITGKGSIKKEKDYLQKTKLYYGKIRNNFISWTTHNAVKSKILNVQQANVENGGDGAFFVYLRKNKN